MKTIISGPYDHIDRDDLLRVQGGIPQTLYHKLFKQQFTNTGAQDRIIANLVNIFTSLCEIYNVPKVHTTSNDLKAQQILTELHEYVRARRTEENSTLDVSDHPQPRQHV